MIGDHLDEDVTVEEVLAEVQKSFVPFFIILTRPGPNAVNAAGGTFWVITSSFWIQPKMFVMPLPGPCC